VPTNVSGVTPIHPFAPFDWFITHGPADEARGCKRCHYSVDRYHRWRNYRDVANVPLGYFTLPCAWLEEFGAKLLGVDGTHAMETRAAGENESHAAVGPQACS
jgi:hypothetical protein